MVGLAALVASVWLALAGGPSAPPVSATAEVYFSPSGGATAAVVRELDKAQRQVRVLAYSFTSAPIAKALADAAGRGVDVQVVLDKSNRTAHYSAADFLVHHGIATRIDDRHAIAHNKVMVIDGRTVITGSFNFTQAAEAHNAENLLVLDSPALAQRYLDNWAVHFGHAIPYGPPASVSAR